MCGIGSAVFLPTLSGCSREAEARQVVAEVERPPVAPITDYDPRVSLAPMIKKVGPAVVSIHAFGKKAESKGLFPAFGGSSRTVRGTGSGFILSADGVVVTNHHVVDGAKRLEVHMPDGKRFDARLLGSDPATDVAVLRLEGASGLPVVTLGTSDDLEVGDWVVAIGSPMGLEHSASVGIVSARGRGSLGLYGDSYLDFLQTDADIAPGSSGGPLFNLQGEVVGITTAVGAGHGAGFAIPIDQAKTIIPALRDEGRVVRGWLGASNAPGREETRGAVIGKVYPGTPAAEAGLRKGDVVTKLDGQPIHDFDELRRRIAELPPGHAALMQVERGGKRLELTAVLGERPVGDAVTQIEDPRRRRQSPASSPPTKRGRLGIKARATDSGIEVVEVTPGTLAADLDLRPGDILLSLNGRTLRTTEDVANALATDDRRVELEMRRGGVLHRVTFERS